MMAKKSDAKYQVGYRKPPRRAQFKKGQSGNPKGRPRGSRNATTLLKEALNAQVIITENGHRRTITKKEAIVTQIVNKAASGDHRSIQLLLLSQLPLIEKSAELSETADPETQVLPPPQSADQKSASSRNREDSQRHRLSGPSARWRSRPRPLGGCVQP
jgi:hypothetical protein